MTCLSRLAARAQIHDRFCDAVHALGVDDAKPQAIAALMQSSAPDAEGLPTRQNIKSHLQKYRLLLTKRRDQSGQGMDIPLAGYGRRGEDLSSESGLDGALDGHFDGVLDDGDAFGSGAHWTDPYI